MQTQTLQAPLLSPVEQQLIVGHRTAEVKPPPPPPVAFRLVMLTMMTMLTMITMILTTTIIIINIIIISSILMVRVL